MDAGERWSLRQVSLYVHYLVHCKAYNNNNNNNYISVSEMLSRLVHALETESRLHLCSLEY